VLAVPRAKGSYQVTAQAPGMVPAFPQVVNVT
jgi:hypothetical protein